MSSIGNDVNKMGGQQHEAEIKKNDDAAEKEATTTENVAETTTEKVEETESKLAEATEEAKAETTDGNTQG